MQDNTSHITVGKAKSPLPKKAMESLQSTLTNNTVLKLQQVSLLYSKQIFWYGNKINIAILQKHPLDCTEGANTHVKGF